MANQKFEEWYKEVATSLLEMAKKTQDSADWQIANDFMKSHSDLEQAFKAGQTYTIKQLDAILEEMEKRAEIEE
jgi:hypothetical protein